MAIVKESPTIVAEVGLTHDGSLGNAQKLIEVAAWAGADAVKFQMHMVEAETLENAPSPSYFTAESRADYFRRTAFTSPQWRTLSLEARSHGISFMSSVFSIEAVDLADDVGVDSLKIPSGEVTNLPLLEHAAGTGRAIILSSGMSNWQELDAAVEVLADAPHLTILQCSSIYPCPPERVGLNVLAEIRKRYPYDVGFSDHTLGSVAAIGALALGATVFEKHIAFSRHMYGSDATHSIEPEEFKGYCSDLRELASIMASPVDKDDLAPYREMKEVFQKSVVARGDLAEGTKLSANDLAYKKPGNGFPVAQYRALLGRRLRRALQKDEQIREEDLS